MGPKTKRSLYKEYEQIFNKGIREAKEEFYYQVLFRYHQPEQNCQGDPQSEQSLFPFLLPQMYIFLYNKQLLIVFFIENYIVNFVPLKEQI